MATKHGLWPPSIVFEVHSIYTRFQGLDGDYTQEFREIFMYIFAGNLEMAQIKYLTLFPSLLQTSGITLDLYLEMSRSKSLFEYLVSGK